MAKVAIKSENMTSFGGLFHVMDTFSKIELGKLIESTLGQHGNTGKAFQYSDILSSVFYSYHCGTDCLEDINTLAPQFSMAPCTVHPSSGTMGRGLKELKTNNEIYIRESSSKEYYFTCNFPNSDSRLKKIRARFLVIYSDIFPLSQTKKERWF